MRYGDQDFWLHIQRREDAIQYKLCEIWDLD